MSNYKNLYNRLRTLINENKSGIVALFGNPRVEQTYEYIAYIPPLQYVYVVTYTYSCYYPASNTDATIFRYLTSARRKKQREKWISRLWRCIRGISRKRRSM